MSWGDLPPSRDSSREEKFTMLAEQGGEREWYRHVQKLTLEEFLKLPETKPASEYIGGQIIQKPMPQESTASYKQSC